MDLTILVFLLVYLVMGLGKLPGFKVDRTGAAIIGALAMMAIGSISASAAWTSINYQTIGMLFGLMVVSSGFLVSGFYGWAAQRITLLPISPPLLLAVLIAAGGGLSALLTNDVVVVAMTPLLVSVTLARGINPIPFLLGFCFAANAGSAGTLIGSPQNMIIAQGLDLSFNGFIKVSGLPALLSLPIVWAVLTLIYKGRWLLNAVSKTTNTQTPQAPTLDLLELTKTAIVTSAVILAFVFSDFPRELIALTGAGILLISRKISSHDMLGNVDGNLLLLIMGLFVVNAAVANTGLPQILLSHMRDAGLDLSEPITLYLVGGILSNIVGNNPAVMLLVPYLHTGQSADALGAALALGTGFSSNMIIFGSLAGIIVVEQAASRGIKISFKEFAKAGIPVTLACMAMAAVWIILLSY
ncbi:SLC13 family permease [Brucellaceae bacterium C25G]